MRAQPTVDDVAACSIIQRSISGPSYGVDLCACVRVYKNGRAAHIIHHAIDQHEAIIPLMLEMLSAVLGTLGHYLGRIFFTAAAALAIYFAVKAARNLFNVSLGRARVRKDRPDANLRFCV